MNVISSTDDPLPSCRVVYQERRQTRSIDLVECNFGSGLNVYAPTGMSADDEQSRCPLELGK
jgi:hypothetical protein